MFARRSPRVLRTVFMLAASAALLAAVTPASAAPWAGNRTTFASPRFEQAWRAADLAVQQGRSTRSWTWGPTPWFDYKEVYKQSPNGLRQVQYFDKTRMEINDPANTGGPLGGVTNGLLVVEMVSGRLKLGDGIGPDQNAARQPSSTPVAGDLPVLGENNSPTPGYASFGKVATTDNGYRDPNKLGQRIGTTFGRDGATAYDQHLANLPGTDVVAYESVTGHNIPRVFDAFRNAGPVPAIVAFGHPITDAYWVTARVAGQERQVLVQLFERRTLTYTPGNPPAFQVEMGNAGQHYFLWRYYGKPWAMQDPNVGITFASKREGGDFTVYEMDAAGNNQQSLGGRDAAILPYSTMRWWLPELPPSYRVIYGDTTAFDGKRQLASLLPQAPLRNRILTGDANDYQPAVSPDGLQLAFVSDRDGNPELYLVGVGQNDPVIRLTETQGCANEHPSWLPDGSGLVFESNCLGGNWEIYRANLSYTVDANARITVALLISPVTGLADRLTDNNADDRWPRVSPDGSQIAFFSKRDGNSEIYTMSVDGSRQTRLTDNPAADEGPTWSPDGSKIAFNSNRDGDHEIFVMNRDGSGLVQLTHNTVADGYALWAQ